MVHDFQSDIDAVARIDAVPTILEVVCRTTGMGFAAVARVTEDRWVACQVLDNIHFGLEPGGELKVETTICHEIRASRSPVIINNVSEDADYCHHHTPATYGFKSYISMPIIRRDGTFFGTLCAIDPAPAKLKNPETIGMFKLFAELIAAQLDSGEQLAQAQGQLQHERMTAELREQFIAVLGHDLRSPVAAIDSGANILLRTLTDEKSQRIVGLIQGSVLRMNGLIDNVVDFARARLGGGLNLELDNDENLQAALEQVIAEVRAAHPDVRIETSFALTGPIPADKARLAQLLSNLLNNALTHGEQGGTVKVSAKTADSNFELWVSNPGRPIPAETLAKLYQPFFRGDRSPNKKGLGLGLYIASEIARAHGGVLSASSENGEVRFTFRMPLARLPSDKGSVGATMDELMNVLRSAEQIEDGREDVPFDEAAARKCQALGWLDKHLQLTPLGHEVLHAKRG